MCAIGFDAGTYNLVAARHNADGKVDCNKQVNAFIKIPLNDPFTYNMLQKSKVPLINRGDHAFAVGDKAVSLARTFADSQLRRPMQSGCVNPHEKEAFSILGTIIHSMIGEIQHDGEPLVYCIPADAVNQETDIAYHREVLKMIFDKYSVNSKKVHAYSINEALALVYAELQDKFMTGFGISFGSGMTNVCFANQSRPVFQFSIVNAGDWIDQQAARAAASTEAIVNREKEKINLLSDPKNEIERAIQIQYRIMISNTVKGIKEGIEKVGRNSLPDEPVDFVLSGGTSSPPGFDVLFKESVVGQGLPVLIGEIKHPLDHLFCVARGCLLAAEASES